ncbi:MAG TPA: AI-2E family transporter [Candidatus Udaeobacter sp.]|jgi:predicted PurR-regulated permease PerM|nr:AI-2E family transporter [Candidatus Udaeobacter sp.]
MEPSTISGTKLRTAFVLLLVVLVSALFLAVIWPFFKPLLLGALLAGLFHPLYRWITRLLGGRGSLGAAVTLLVLFVLGLGPVSAFFGIVLQQALTMSDQALPWLNQHLGAATTFNVQEWAVHRFPALARYVPNQEQLLQQVGTAAKTAGTFLVGFASRMTATTAAFLLNLFVMLYAMFFFFRDGNKILERIFYYTPLNDDDEARMLTQLSSITRATVKGTLVIGIIQGTLAGIAFWVAGIEGAALWGTIMTVLSVIPGIGSALVWVPAVIILFVMGEYLTASLLAAWCAAVVGTIDNFLRPVLVGRDAKMPDLLILIGTLGGLFLFGPIGFIVGPIVCGLFLTVWDIYGATFREVLPPVTSFQPSDQEAPASAPQKSAKQ